MSDLTSRFAVGRSALIVDDDALVSEVLEAALEDMGFELSFAGSVQEAVAALDGASFDILILDKNLPDGSGLEVARAVRERELDSEMIMLTGYQSTASAIEALQLGVADYLTKPLTHVNLLSVVLKRVLDVQGLRRERLELLEQLQSKSEDLAQKNRELEALAVRDPLTKLFNHAFLHEQVDATLHSAERHGHEFGLIFLDFDGFKQVNDTLGHQAGDTLLVRFAEVLRGDSRAEDVPFRLRSEDVAARYGGDEFVLLLPETPKRGAVIKAERLRAFVESFDFGIPGLLRQTISIGVAGYPSDAHDRMSIIDAADRALYAAKHAGRNRLVAFSSDIPAVAARGGFQQVDAGRADALSRSIADSAFDVAFQPIVRADDGSVFAYEALCRPREPAFPHPGVLIETAEQLGKIRELGRVLRRCTAREIPKLDPDALVFVNLHPHELFDPELQNVEPFFEAFADRIVLEVTETANIEDYNRLKKTLTALSAAGFRSALDDLGAGYSGLNSLAHIEPDFVKLDMKLVRAVVNDKRARRLVQHILEFSEQEGMLVIAEGVETETERDVLLEMRCPLLQGYLFGRPACL
jgi:diguanylate cyclase (GGDEF)-like protein